MPENFRLSVLSFNRQSYDLTQAVNSADPNGRILGAVTVPELVCDGGPTLEQRQVNGNTSVLVNTGPIIRKSSSKPSQRDFWLCTGMLFIIAMLFAAGILLIKLGFPSTTDFVHHSNKTVM